MFRVEALARRLPLARAASGELVLDPARRSVVYADASPSERSVHTGQAVIPRRARGYEIAGGAVAAGRHLSMSIRGSAVRTTLEWRSTMKYAVEVRARTQPRRLAPAAAPGAGRVFVIASSRSDSAARGGSAWMTDRTDADGQRRRIF
jgi:hypothetical protein